MSATNGSPDSINGWNADYVDSLYEQWKSNPDSLDEKWRAFFQGFELALSRPSAGAAAKGKPERPADAPGDWVDATRELESLQSKVDSLIYHYRDVGHLLAKIDPLGRTLDSHPFLALDAFGISEDLLDMVFHTNHIPWTETHMTLREIIAGLRETYCGSIGVEYMDIQNTPERRWLQKRMEPIRNRPAFAQEKKLRTARLLRRASAFERFLQTNYVGQKRFSLEGAETLIPLLDTVIERAGSLGVEEVVLGMAHRGRLNVLANIMQKSYEEIFTEFEDNYAPGMIMGDGDVKYHKGFSTDWTTALGHRVHLTLTANPSHLEAVDPVVLGRVRSKQRRRGDDKERRRVMGVLIHGDAAFAGQGIVTESLNLSQLQGYRTGGTIHVIINNQIGFTTAPEDARSGRYCTDVAKMIQAPIFHVNGDDPEAVLLVAEIAAEFRQEFKKDVVIDMMCYRRHGHNEGDEPSFTQPKMYDIIRNHPSPLEIYTKKLLADGVATPQVIDQMAAELDKTLADAQERAHKSQITPADRPFQASWAEFQIKYSHEPIDTGVSADLLKKIGLVWSKYPDGFAPNKKVERIIEKRAETVRDGKGLDWATGEGLAIGSLLVEGYGVRLSGQDVRRGTFSHRHAVLWDVNTQEKHIPLQHIAEGQERLCVYDSPLSEAAVLGFDYGYSLDEPDMLICWEAQFGDFANGAQTIIDQFIATSESKWNRVSGITLLLPHGYEGQGPEHSSGWMERFLQLAAEENIQVCNVTTPAQYFHLLRRQLHRNFRKPLVVMSPKSLLRHPKAVSDLSEMLSGTSFVEIVDDKGANPQNVRRVVFCSGKVYYDLEARREAEKIDDTALVRVEQLYPFHTDLAKKILARYKMATEFLWCQEETQNKGGWTFMSDMLKDQLGIEFKYIGRARHASPAVGSLKKHQKEQERIISETLSLATRTKVAAGVGK